MNKKKFLTLTTTGFALFAMFFGAGNLVIPPYIGLKMGAASGAAFAGFFLSGIFIPFLAVLMVSSVGSTFSDLGKRFPAPFVNSLVVLIIVVFGPIVCVPRSGSTTYEVAIEPFFPVVGKIAFGAIFFAITLFLALSRSKLVDIIGRWLTPILFLSLIVLIVEGTMNAPKGLTDNGVGFKEAFTFGFSTGYLTLDVLSGVILSLGNVMALIFLGVIIFGLLMFTIRFFDNDRDSISMEDIKEFTISIKKLNAENIKEKLSQKINAAELQKVVTNTKYLFLKPKQKKAKNEKIPWGDIMVATKKEFGIIWEIISATPMHYGLIWGLILVLIFGFWDTFASSFLIDYLDAIKPGFGYILLAAIGIPGIVLQEVAIKLGQKIGDKNIGLVGLALSGGSLLVMGIMAIGEPPSAMSIILVALINSLGYACGMAIGQNAFLDIYNRTYADHENLKEIDANASAGPMKVIQNLANVVGLTLGGILLVAGFSVFFFIFAIVIIATLVWTIMKRKEINV